MTIFSKYPSKKGSPEIMICNSDRYLEGQKATFDDLQGGSVDSFGKCKWQRQASKYGFAVSFEARFFFCFSKLKFYSAKLQNGRGQQNFNPRIAISVAPSTPKFSDLVIDLKRHSQYDFYENRRWSIYDIGRFDVE